MAANADVRFALLSMALSTLLAVVFLELWRADPGIPLSYNHRGAAEVVDDTHQMATFVKGVLETGWIHVNPALGAPLGAEHYDFAHDRHALQFLVLKGMGLFTDSWGGLMNVWYLLGFPLAALASFVVMRRFEIERWTALVCSVLFALLPFHFIRGEHHLFVSAYFVVPLAAYLVLMVLRGERVFRRRPGGGRLLGWLTPLSLVTTGLCAAVVWTELYTAMFMVVLLVPVSVLGALAARSGRPLAEAGVLIALTMVLAAAVHLPILDYQREHGVNAALERQASESEQFSLTLAQLVVPIQEHRLEPLREIGRDYMWNSSLGEGTSNLGLVGTIGFLWLLCVAGLTLVGRRVRARGAELERQLSTLTLIAFVIATTGGVSILIAHNVATVIRGWNRMSVLIAFFALTAVALLLDRLRGRLAAGPHAAALAAAALAAVLGIGALDQTSSAYVPKYDRIEAVYRSDRTFVTQIEQRLGPDGAVFQLPYLPYPEGFGAKGVNAYDHLRGYLHSKDLRWSFGAMKGRPEDFAPGLLDRKPWQMILASLAAAGFDGIWIDRYGYDDRARRLERQIGRIAGAVAFASPNDRQSFFDIREYAERLRSSEGGARIAEMRRAALQPYGVRWGPEFLSEHTGLGRRWRWAGRRARLEVENRSEAPRRVTFDAELETARVSPSEVVIRYPDGSTSRVRTNAFGQRVRHTFTLRPGENTIVFETDSPARRIEGGGLARQRVIEATLTEDVLTRFGKAAI